MITIKLPPGPGPLPGQSAWNYVQGQEDDKNVREHGFYIFYRSNAGPRD